MYNFTKNKFANNKSHTLLLKNQIPTIAYNSDAVMIGCVIENEQYFLCGYNLLSKEEPLVFSNTSLLNNLTPNIPISWTIVSSKDALCGQTVLTINNPIILLTFYEGVEYYLTINSSGQVTVSKTTLYKNESTTPSHLTLSNSSGSGNNITYGYNNSYYIQIGNESLNYFSVNNTPSIELSNLANANSFSFYYYPDDSIIKLQCCSGLSTTQYPQSFCNAYLGNFTSSTNPDVPFTCGNVVSSYCMQANNSDPYCVNLYKNRNIISHKNIYIPNGGNSNGNPQKNWNWIIAGVILLIIAIIIILIIIFGYLFYNYKSTESPKSNTRNEYLKKSNESNGTSESNIVNKSNGVKKSNQINKSTGSNVSSIPISTDSTLSTPTTPTSSISSTDSTLSTPTSSISSISSSIMSVSDLFDE